MAGLGFARSQLEKQGWTEGKGLGKEEDGITKAIKVGIKNDTRGVGYNISDQFTFHWWDHVFNKTAKSIVVNENEDGVHLSKDGSSNQPISNKRPNKHSKKPLLYGRFVKASSNTTSETEKGSESTGDEAEKDFSTRHPEDIVFKACGGRTAHKGARHGLKLNGKLKRIEEHDRMAISAPCSRSASPEITKELDIEQKTAKLLDQSKSKKKKRRSNDVISYSDSEGCLVKKKKKESKKKRRHIEEIELENEVYEEQSKKKRKNSSKKDFCEEKEEPSSCSSLPKTKKDRKERNRMDGNVNDKTEKKNKSLDSDNEQCSGLENQQNTEGAKTKKDKAKTKKDKAKIKDSIAKSEDKVVTEDTKKRKTKKRKATKIETISQTKTDDNELRSESEESSARKKKKKKRD